MAVRKEQKSDAPETRRTKQEWIESAASLKAERFEMAGALFDVKENDLVAEGDVKRRLVRYKGGE
ncbi:hypothetical protein I532_01485 [Brevibacillus borstelensis AK1]|uniref:Uncharacterized protein n=1 Tax=Brevibacillus borstelensis AK1 TaxID=1300222 RepID=M8DL71_9BACL|nr:hypothetical protein [Brevibacillus borstelensis]EMT54237.1 hypothetical protein I532_01485 [Brevibacillus borstelensis AK1]MED2007006.1 hypothetical protein [Brevibacillus borstelensis]